MGLKPVKDPIDDDDSFLSDVIKIIFNYIAKKTDFQPKIGHFILAPTRLNRKKYFFQQIWVNLNIFARFFFDKFSIPRTNIFLYFLRCA